MLAFDTNRDVRAACSGLAQIDQSDVDRWVATLRADLDSGRSGKRQAGPLAAEEYDAGFRLIVRGW